MLYATNVADFPQAAEATRHCILAALADATAARIVLAQTLLDPADASAIALYSSAGLSPLTTLTYMERKPPLLAPTVHLPPGLRLEPYSADNHGVFRAAILASYEQTLDCPALSDIRDIEDVITGHKAVGTFDPQLWSLVLSDEPTPLGCLLLAHVPARQALEIVYLGLSPAARGRGIGRALMQRTLAIAARRHFALSSLAVDVQNAPALRLYRRFGYTAVMQRLALIRAL